MSTQTQGSDQNFLITNQSHFFHSSGWILDCSKGSSSVRMYGNAQENFVDVCLIVNTDSQEFLSALCQQAAQLTKTEIKNVKAKQAAGMTVSSEGSWKETNIDVVKFEAFIRERADELGLQIITQDLHPTPIISLGPIPKNLMRADPGESH